METGQEFITSAKISVYGGGAGYQNIGRHFIDSLIRHTHIKLLLCSKYTDNCRVYKTKFSTCPQVIKAL